MLQWSLSTVSELSNLDINAKDTLVKEIVNNELIVSVTNNIKATFHDAFVQDKVVAVIAKDDEINEVITVHLVKIIVPFLFGAPRCRQMLY